MRPFALFMVLSFNNFTLPLGQILKPPRRYNVDADDPDYNDNHIIPDLTDYDNDNNNGTDKGTYVGGPCDRNCSSRLSHVYCDPITNLCRCKKGYPVQLNPTTGCGKPKRLGEQCYYRESCLYSDSHSSCIQVHHNAICQCDSGYHLVSLQKPSNRTFCAADVKIMTTDYSTLAGVLSGIALLSGLICFVLHLFNQNRYGGPHRFANANIPPPIFFSNDAGSRRPSISSIHSGSSIRSYSAKRFERDREMKEEREMQKRLAKMTAAMQANGRINQPTPSPRSTDELLPTLTEDKPVFSYSTITL
ncbi:uncharacterized protein LOC108739678 isoform X2 [Agrilus planipennis]|uniref:Uncharacterized protein LOC108739678 isoform X2 n=1 Tax=Agrilus planipennis TaxID=224129 RepID=A0A1W4WZB9_AGRPL|nr:uncharacterized protein LOC108739678 isoform X2 [Agrilus planipennis]